MEKATILNVDDNEVNRYLRTQALIAAGYDVVEADTGEAALTEVARRCPPLVLLDVSLPDVDGVEVCRRIKERPPDCTAIVVNISAVKTTQGDRIVGLETGADAYLVEPVEPELLVATVRSMLRLWKAERSLRESHRHLRQSEEQFRTLANSIPHLCWMANPDGSRYWFNEQWYQYTGTGFEQVQGWGWLSLHHPESVPAMMEGFKTAVGAGQPFEAVSRLRGADGVFRPFLLRAVPVRDSEGRVVRWFGTNTDITAQLESEQRLRRLVDSNVIGIVVADRNRVKDANDLFLGVIGCTREDLERGKIDWLTAVPPEYRERCARAIEEVAERGSFGPFEKEYIRPDGTRVPVLLGGARLSSEPLEWIAFIVDLTERRALEARLLQSQKLESVGLLAGGIAHDFNNLLVGIMGNASLLQDMLPAEKSVQRVIDNIVNAAERAAHLTREMLAYSGKGRFLIQPINLSDVVRDVSTLSQSAVPSKVAVQLDLADKLPKVDGDPGQMQQLVMNLFLNAVESIHDRAGVVSVRTSVRIISECQPCHPAFADLQPGTYVSLEIRDTGSGMDRETQARIFDPFFTTKFTGRGLGLAAVTGIVRGHKGAIHVSSLPGEGSTFEVLLPASKRTETPVPKPESEETDLQGTGRVLVIDDEDIVRRTAKSALERHGYDVSVADSGLAALEIVRQRQQDIDLVILDLSMPGMDGQGVLRQLREISPEMPVIVSSGYSEADCRRLFAGENIAGFIQKPYTAARLAACVKPAMLEAKSRKDTA